MANTNLDGYGSIDVLLDPDGPSGTVATSIKCQYNFLRFVIFTGLFSYTTFCSSTWQEVREGVSGASFTMAGFMAKGTVYSAPGSMKGLPAAATLTYQYDTGCTILFNPKVSGDDNSVGAYAPSARVVDGLANGQPTITWVTS